MKHVLSTSMAAIRLGFAVICNSCSTEEKRIEDNHSTGLAISTEKGLKSVSPKEFTGTKLSIDQSRDIEGLIKDFRSSYMPKVDLQKSPKTPETVVKAYGYKEKNRKMKHQKMIISNDKAREMGLYPGIYVIDTYQIKQKMFCQTGKYIEVYPGYNENLNYRNKMGFIANSFSTKRGFTTDAPTITTQDSFWGETYLMHVISDLGGRSMDLWWPCSPENLIWIYQIRDSGGWGNL